MARSFSCGAQLFICGYTGFSPGFFSSGTYSAGGITGVAEFGCGEYVDTQGTPLGGTTLLHMCIDWDEFEIAQWLVEKGADVNAKSAVHGNGFGGYTPLFGVVVCYAIFWGNYRGDAPDTRFAKLLLDQGTNVNVRASIRRLFKEGGKEFWKEFRDLTPLSWGDVPP